MVLWVLRGLDRREESASVFVESRDGATRRVIHVENGQVVGTQSSMQAERLGNMLVGEGILDVALLEPVAAEAQRRKVLLGEQLVADHLLTPEELLEAVERQVALRLGAALAMRGVVTESPFQPPSALIPVKMSVAAALLAAFRKAVPMDVVGERLAAEEECNEWRMSESRRASRIELGPAESRYAHALANGQSLEELLQQVTEREPVLRLVAGLKSIGWC